MRAGIDSEGIAARSTSDRALGELGDRFGDESRIILFPQVLDLIG